LDNSGTKRCSNIEGNNSEGKAMQVTKGSDNVFEDIGFEAEEAANLKVRADLMLDLRRFIEDQGWTQEQAVSFFGETQPCISNLIDGEINRFSVDKLINMLTRAGMQLRVSVEPKVA
jgi:predicted XRE-type DNA-binding protein